MNRALEETKWLYNHLLNEEQKNTILSTLENIDSSENNYSLDDFWKEDEAIGGIGGFNLPKNPVSNPFPYGIKRSIFRPLQYAAGEMDIRDIRYSSRYVVMYSGMHLEATLKFFLMTNQSLGKLRNYNSTLGKVVHKIDQLNLLDKKTIVNLYKFIQLYNKSKHEVNQDINRNRLFTPTDALVIYLAARIIGSKVLQRIDPAEFSSTLEV